LPPWAPFAGAAAVILLAVVIAFTARGVGLNKKFNVAFVGSGGTLFMNDIPRVMELISDGKITQGSCLHIKGSLTSILSTGNGMYAVWQTDNAKVDKNEYTYYYDYGACTVPQLLLGSDDQLYVSNYNGAYYDDGRNPCFYDDNYLSDLEKAMYDDEEGGSSPTKWDFVVFSDKTKRMAFQDTRDDALDSFESDYASMIETSGAIPVIVDGHAFWSENTNMTGLEDIPTFASLVYEGARQYQEKLAELLPRSQKPRIAPVGLAFLAIYEDDPDMWEKLFVNDLIHASVYGTYLTACVIFCTITKHMPRAGTSEDVKSLFATARLVSGAGKGYPDQDEAAYLFNKAAKVARRGYKPKSLELY